MSSALLSARTVARTALFGLAATAILTGCGNDRPDGTLEVISTGSPVSVKSTVTTPAPSDSPSTDKSGSSGGSKSPAKPGSAGKSGSTGNADSTNSGGGVRMLNGTRNVVIVPVPSTESIVALDPQMRLGVTDGDPKYGLFVFTPVNGKYLISTAEADSSGEAPCLRVKTNGSASLTVVTALCDSRDALQLFTVAVDNAKKSTYSISNQSAFLQLTSQGELIAEELGDAPLSTTFKLIDNGKATLPALD